ncbi:hypothetical protein ACFVY4_26695 [Streptomyces sp. NPDC058299]
MTPQSACRVCGTLVSVKVGKKCPNHQAANHREKCPGSSQGTVRI